MVFLHCPLYLYIPTYHSSLQASILHYAFYTVNAPIDGFDTDMEKFLGIYNGFEAPDSVLTGKGLNWGGYTDEYRSFDWEPLIHPNVIGMNAQLWGEVIRSFSQVEWQIYPKIYGLVERAWNNRSALTLSEYNQLVYEVFLPQLAASGRHFHIQQPGVKQLTVDSLQVIVAMNKVMEGGEIIYRVDNGEWQVYHAPVLVPEGTEIVQAKVRYLGKESNTTWLWLEK